MSRRDGKVETDGGQALGNAAFAGLDASGLQAGPQNPPLRTGGNKPGKKRLGRVEVRREKSGRGGKTVTTLSAFPSNYPLRNLERLAFDLKKACACGGTLKGRVIELQGDVRDRVLPLLEKAGFTPVRAGG